MTVTTKFLELLAKNLLPLMDDPRAFDTPPPPCTAHDHYWGIVYDKAVTEQFLDATITCTYPVAVECCHCGFIVGLGG